MKITIEKMNEKIPFINMIGDSKIEEGKTVPINDKVSYALNRLDTRIKQVTKKLEKKLQEAKEDLKVECAATDEKGLLIIVGNNYQYTKEGRLTMNKRLRDLDETFFSSEIEFEPFFFKEGEPGYERLAEVDEDVREALEGILFLPKANKEAALSVVE